MVLLLYEDVIDRYSHFVCKAIHLHNIGHRVILICSILYGCVGIYYPDHVGIDPSDRRTQLNTDSFRSHVTVIFPSAPSGWRYTSTYCIRADTAHNSFPDLSGPDQAVH